MSVDPTLDAAHQRLLSGDPTISAELAETASSKLIEHLRRRFPNHRDHEMFQDAAHETLIKYIIQPGQFDPHKRSLLGFLKMSAEGDFRNLLAKKERSEKNLQSGVELDQLAGNRSAEDDPALKLIGEELRQQWRELLPDQVDRQILDLMTQGKRETEEFVQVLRIGHLPLQEQRAIVKRHKDRIKVTIKRHEQSIRQRE